MPSEFFDLNFSGTGFSGGYYWIHPVFVMLAPAIVPDWAQLSIKISNSFYMAA